MTIIDNQIAVNLDAILLATDFSPSAQTAQVYAQALAHRYQSEMRVVHVVDLGAASNIPEAGLSIDVFRRFGEDALERLRTQLLAEKLREGIDPAKEILRAAQDRSIDLMVIGTRGHRGLAKLVLGSTAEQLIHQASCPVLTIGPAVPPPRQPIQFERIVYATDFSAEAAKACVFALSFAEDCGAHLYLCHVLPQSSAVEEGNDEELNEAFIKALRQLVPDVAREWCEPECVLEHGYAADGIHLLAQRVKADLIVLGTRRASHWYDNFKTDVAFQVISRSACPVLTIRA
jgi:nucleotide-binding universal stress UspA family protein